MKLNCFHSRVIFVLSFSLFLFACEEDSSILISGKKQAISGVWNCEEFYIDGKEALQLYKDSTGDFKFAFENIRVDDHAKYFFHAYIYNDSIYFGYQEHYTEVQIGRYYTKLHLSFGNVYIYRDDSSGTGEKPIGIGPLANNQYADWEIQILLYKELLVMSTYHKNKQYLIKLKYLKEIENEPKL